MCRGWKEVADMKIYPSAPQSLMPPTCWGPAGSQALGGPGNHGTPGLPGWDQPELFWTWCSDVRRPPHWTAHPIPHLISFGQSPSGPSHTVLSHPVSLLPPRAPGLGTCSFPSLSARPFLHSQSHRPEPLQRPPDTRPRSWRCTVTSGGSLEPPVSCNSIQSQPLTFPPTAPL